MVIATFDYFEFEIPKEAVLECSHIGDCYEDVSYWQGIINLSHISDDNLIKALSDYGAWTNEELQNRIENEKRIIWIASGNIQEGNN